MTGVDRANAADVPDEAGDGVVAAPLERAAEAQDAPSDGRCRTTQ